MSQNPQRPNPVLDPVRLLLAVVGFFVSLTGLIAVGRGINLYYLYISEFMTERAIDLIGFGVLITLLGIATIVGALVGVLKKPRE